MRILKNKNGSTLTQVNIVIIVLSLSFIIVFSFMEHFLKGAKKKGAVVMVERIAEGEKRFSSTKNYLFINRNEISKFKKVDIDVKQFKYFEYWVEPFDAGGFIVHARTKKNTIRKNELPPLHYTYKYVEGRIDKGEW